MSNRISRALEVPARAWCKLMHPDPMWPVSGFYRCPTCLRQYPVQWESHPSQAAITEPVRLPATLRPEFLPLLRHAVPVPVPVGNERQGIKVLSATTAL
jgi:hypothetical protein